MANNKSYLPDKSRIIDTITFEPPAKTKAAFAAAAPGAAPKFRILRTNILDPYETKHSPKVIAAAAVALAAVASDNFAGKDRKAAKLSIAPGPVKEFDDLGDLLDSLPKDADMKKLKIPKGPTSNRVQQEKKNVGVDAWLYAASREGDNDFHIILGRDPDDTPRRFMNAEVSGLPTDDPPRTKLQGVRTSFSNIVDDNTPGLGYDFYDPPIPVSVEGSLFWDATHATGSKPGPSKTKPKTIWEIHPITKIKAR
jgi:hypothetical protein